MSKAKEAADKVKAAVAGLNEALSEASGEGLIVTLNAIDVTKMGDKATRLYMTAKILQEVQ